MTRCSLRRDNLSPDPRAVLILLTCSPELTTFESKSVLHTEETDDEEEQIYPKTDYPGFEWAPCGSLSG